MRQQIVGTHVLEHAARRLAHRRARGGNDIGVLHLFCHGDLLGFDCAQFLSGLPVLSICSMRAWVFWLRHNLKVSLRRKNKRDISSPSRSVSERLASLE